MSSNRTPSYTEQLDKLRNDLHRDVVQTAGLKDVMFNGIYKFINPIETFVTYYTTDRILKFMYVKIMGINWDGNIVAEDEEGKDQHIRYNQLTLENLNDMLLNLRDETRYHKSSQDFHQDEPLLNLFGKKIF